MKIILKKNKNEPFSKLSFELLFMNMPHNPKAKRTSNSDQIGLANLNDKLDGTQICPKTSPEISDLERIFGTRITTDFAGISSEKTKEKLSYENWSSSEQATHEFRKI